MLVGRGEGESEGGDRLKIVASYVMLSSVSYYAAAIGLLHILRTDFDPKSRYLSEYVVGPYGAIMTSTFFVLSVGSLALLLGLWRSVSPKLRFLPGLLLWLVWACAVFFAGVYPTDLQGSPQTRNGQIHNQVSMIAFPCATLALPLLSLPLRWDKRLQSVWRSTMLLSLIVIISFLASDWFGERQLAGLDQRVFLGSALIWMWVLGRKMLALGKQRKRQQC